MNERLKLWLRGLFIETFEYKFGPHEEMTDLVIQVKYWGCWGCSAKSTTRWPTWGKPEIKHDADCKYIEFMELLK